MEKEKHLKTIHKFNVASLVDYIMKRRKIIIILIAVFVTITMNIKLDVNDVNIDDVNVIEKFLTLFNKSFEKNNNFQSLLIFIVLNFFFSKTLLLKRKNNGKGIYKIILSVIFTVIVLLGKSYEKYNSWDMIFFSRFHFWRAFFVGIGYYIVFKAIINYLFDDLFEKIKYKECKNRLFNFIFEQHCFIVPVLIILICWLPYIIIYFPGTIMQDSCNQILQFFGYDIYEASATNSVNLIDENIKITNHHPVIHTVMLGICIKLGKLIGSDNVGVFLCSLTQILLLSISFGAIFKFMKETKTKNCIRVVSLLGFAVIPVFPVFALYITKDIPFTALFIFYLIEFYWIVKKSKSENIPIKKFVYSIIIGLAMCFMNHKGIYIILFSLPMLIVINKTNRKKAIIMFVAIFAIYESFNSFLLPALKIAPNSIREMLSIPFQQTARYVREHEEDVTEYEKNVIDKVLDYETLSERYVPDYADNVKNKYNKNATKEDLQNYYKVWFAQFLKHPTTYIEAALNNCYGYIWPDASARTITSQYTVNSNEYFNESGDFDYYYTSIFESHRKCVELLLKIIQKIPIISWSVNSGISVWAILIMLGYMCYQRKHKYTIVFLPIISIILIGLVSPGYIYRYSIAYIWAMPLIIGMFLDIMKKDKC